MELTKENMKDFLNENPIARLFLELSGITPEDLINEINTKEKASTNNVKEAKVQQENTKPSKCTENCYNQFDDKFKHLLNKVKENDEVVSDAKDVRPHYSIKLEGDPDTAKYTAPSNPDTLVEDEGSSSFSMTKDELEEFIRDYTRLENTVHKLEYTYGIDLNASANSIYTQYNELIWRLIAKIFGEENREDIVDYCYGNSNFDSVENLYEELV